MRADQAGSRGPRRRRRAPQRLRAGGLQVIRSQVAGIDLGAHEHWVCGPARADGQPNVEVFRTTTAGLEQLAAWLGAHGVESIAMESTGVYWIPLYELLEAQGFEVVLVSTRQLRHVAGRKSDMRDCQWIQLLHSCGLLQGSFRPAEWICRLRTLQREQANLVRDRTRVVQRMQKALDQMNVRVHRAVSDLTGQTGLAIVRAIVAGERTPHTLARLRDPRCKQSREQIAEHLTGTWREEHLFTLQMTLRQFEQLEALIAEYAAQLARWLAELAPPERHTQTVPPHPNPAKEKALRRRGEHAVRTALWRVAGVDLTRIDGISSASAQLILTELGLTLTAFPDEHHFVGWLRLCPPTAITGGKPLRGLRPPATGVTRVAQLLRMAALALRRSPTALGAYFRRIARRKDTAVAIFATARKLAVLVYRMLRYGQDYVDEGAAAYEARFLRQRLATLHSSALQLGYNLVPIAKGA